MIRAFFFFRPKTGDILSGEVDDCIDLARCGEVDLSGTDVPADVVAVWTRAPGQCDDLVTVGLKKGGECAADQAAGTADEDPQRLRRVLVLAFQVGSSDRVAVAE